MYLEVDDIYVPFSANGDVHVLFVFDYLVETLCFGLSTRPFFGGGEGSDSIVVSAIRQFAKGSGFESR